MRQVLNGQPSYGMYVWLFDIQRPVKHFDSSFVTFSSTKHCRTLGSFHFPDLNSIMLSTLEGTQKKDKLFSLLFLFPSLSLSFSHSLSPSLFLSHSPLSDVIWCKTKAPSSFDYIIIYGHRHLRGIDTFLRRSVTICLV